MESKIISSKPTNGKMDTRKHDNSIGKEERKNDLKVEKKQRESII